MQKNRVLYLAAVLICTALFYTVNGVLALGAKQPSERVDQSEAQHYFVNGVIQAKNGNVWTVDGRDYTIDMSTVSAIQPNVGDPIILKLPVTHRAPVVAASTTSVPATTAPTKEEIQGVVTVISTASITIDGVVYSLSNSSEVSKAIQPGDTVKVELTTSSDGSLTAGDVELIQTASSTGQGSGMEQSHKNHEKDDEHKSTGMSNSSGKNSDSSDESEKDDDDSQGSSGGSSGSGFSGGDD